MEGTCTLGADIAATEARRSGGLQLAIWKRILAEDTVRRRSSWTGGPRVANLA